MFECGIMNPWLSVATWRQHSVLDHPPAMGRMFFILRNQYSVKSKRFWFDFEDIAIFMTKKIYENKIENVLIEITWKFVK
jgi:hypothetical protein